MLPSVNVIWMVILWSVEPPKSAIETVAKDFKKKSDAAYVVKFDI